MKLLDLFEQNTIDYSPIIDYVLKNSHTAAKDNTVNYIMKNEPDLVYTGPMYRIFSMRYDEFLTNPNLASVSVAFHNNNSINDNKQIAGNIKYQSWAKGEQGVRTFAAKYYEKNAITFVFSQKSSGLDINKVFENHASKNEQLEFSDEGYDFDEEVLSPIEPTASIVGFMDKRDVRASENYRPPILPISKMREFLAQMKLPPPDHD